MAERAERVRPRFGGIISYNIGAHYLYWDFVPSFEGDYQTGYQIYVFDPDTGERVRHIRHYEDDQLYYFHNLSIPHSGYYQWNIRLRNSRKQWGPWQRVRALLKYEEVPYRPKATFDEPIDLEGSMLRWTPWWQQTLDNFHALNDHYIIHTQGKSSHPDDKLPTFLQDIRQFPRYQDFNDMYWMIRFMYWQEVFDENHVYETPEQTWAGKTVGESDLQWIDDNLQDIATRGPHGVRDVSFGMDEPDMYRITHFRMQDKQDGKNTVVDLSWNRTTADYPVLTVNIDIPSRSTDLRYYNCWFDYGYPRGMFETYFNLSYDQVNYRGYSFRVRLDGPYTYRLSGETRMAPQLFSIQGVDHQDNEGDKVSFSYSHPRAVPMGLDHYEVQAQTSDNVDASPNSADRYWEAVGTTTDPSFRDVRSPSGGNKVFYRVRAVDLSGLTSDWEVLDDAVIVARPPSKVFGLDAEGGLKKIQLDWDTARDAKGYRIYRDWEHVATTSSTRYTDRGLDHHTQYTYYVEAYNDHYTGERSTIAKARTLIPPIRTVIWPSIDANSWRSRGKGWRNERTVRQGEWYQYGNHKGIWYFDWRDIQQTLRGCRIIDADFKFERLAGGYSTVPNAFSLWTHNYDRYNTPSGEPKVWTNIRHTWGSGYHNHDYELTKNQSTWADIPTSYVERMRDGYARGLAVYETDRTPYLTLSWKSWLRVTFQEYY